MNPTAQLTPQEKARLARTLHGRLFDDPDLGVFAVLDGASIPELLPRLAEAQPEHACLYRGELAPDLAQCAPYLVRLTPDSLFTQWLVEEGWGAHWGVFALAALELEKLRRHFRTFLVVKDPDGKQLYFRYYDPRVLRVYLPTCNARELATVFGPVKSYLLEDENPATLLRFLPGQAPPKREAISLLQP